MILNQLAAHQNAHDGGHHQAAGPSGGIAQAVQAGNVRFQVGVHLDLVGIELQLRAVQQGFRCGKAGGNMVHHLDELNNAHHGAVRHGGGNVARNGIFQGRLLAK